MESVNNIFPVFGPLHVEDSQTPAIAIEKRTRRENEAGLFIVSEQNTEQSSESGQIAETHPPRVTGELPCDLATAMYCLAFLSEFFNALESSDLRRIASLMEATR